MANPWDDTEDELPHAHRLPDPVHYTRTQDLRTMISPPICGHDMTAASTSVTNLSERVTCVKCKELLAKET